MDMSLNESLACDNSHCIISCDYYNSVPNTIILNGSCNVSNKSILYDKKHTNCI